MSILGDYFLYFRLHLLKQQLLKVCILNPLKRKSNALTWEFRRNSCGASRLATGMFEYSLRLSLQKLQIQGKRKSDRIVRLAGFNLNVIASKKLNDSEEFWCEPNILWSFTLDHFCVSLLFVNVFWMHLFPKVCTSLSRIMLS